MTDEQVTVEKTDTPAAAPQAKKGPRGQVTIFANWCKGCGICVAFCPTGVFALDDTDHPVVVHPEKCTACHWCDTHCPDFAIVVKKIAP
ncbi:MAG TPA: 4Fe-4S binding protein [Anaerolineales bacterium]|nr:4Fe-4S binding protein [Anaerolineales bacterium]